MSSKSQIAFGLKLVVMVLLGSCSSLPERSPNNETLREIGAKGISPTPVPGRLLSAANRQADLDDDDGPYSVSELKSNFKEADVVAFADVVSFKADNMEKGYRPYTLTARIKEVFKGRLKADEIVEFGYTSEVYDKEPDDSEFLGERVLWLKRWKDRDGIFRFGQIEFMAAGIEYNILEKLRKISSRHHRIVNKAFFPIGGSSFL